MQAAVLRGASFAHVTRMASGHLLQNRCQTHLRGSKSIVCMKSPWQQARSTTKTIQVNQLKPIAVWIGAHCVFEGVTVLRDLARRNVLLSAAIDSGEDEYTDWAGTTFSDGTDHNCKVSCLETSLCMQRLSSHLLTLSLSHLALSRCH